MLWRGVVFLPLVLLMMAARLAVVSVVLYAGVWGVTFALIEQWWEATACGGVFAACVHVALWFGSRARREKLRPGLQHNQSPPGVSFL